MQLTLEQLGLQIDTADIPDYIVIEGPIGVGKSTLAKALSYSLKYDLLLETPEENPFLARFYEDRKSYALQTQLSFLFQRTRQLSSLIEGDLFRSSYISDFILEKDPLFAEVTLDAHEFELYNTVYQHVVSETPQPDLVVYLQAPVPVLSQRIRHRGIDAEQNITNEYLAALNDAYMRFFHRYDGAPLLVVNAAEIDFANNPDHYRELARRILTTHSNRSFYSPVTREL